jgi:hypothetical protein
MNWTVPIIVPALIALPRTIQMSGKQFKNLKGFFTTERTEITEKTFKNSVFFVHSVVNDLFSDNIRIQETHQKTLLIFRGYEWKCGRILRLIEMELS